MNTEESNHQCPTCNEYLSYADDVDTLGYVYYCSKCNEYWEVDLGCDPETGDELFYIYRYEKNTRLK